MPWSINPLNWFKGSRSSESPTQTSATPLAAGSNQRPAQQTASTIGHRQSAPIVVSVHQPKSAVPNVASTSTPVSRPLLGPAPTVPIPQVNPKQQTVNSDTVNLTRVELDDFKRKLESVALNMAKVSAESERVSRSNEQWVLNFSDRQKVLDVTAKLTIENNNVKLLEAKVRDSGEEIKNYQGSLEKQEEKIKKLTEELASITSSLKIITSERDDISRQKSVADSALETMLAAKNDLEAQRLEAVERGNALESDLSATRTALESKIAELNAVVAGIKSRLAQFSPQGILESKLAAEVAAFDAAAASGNQASLRVMAGLSQLRAGFIPGAGPDDKLAAVKSLGSALHAAWSAQSKDPKATHMLFVEWQNFLNDLPGAGYQLIVPDLGQSVPQNVVALDGATKVNEVLLWIVKGADGGIYSKGIVR